MGCGVKPSNGWGGGLRKVVGSALHPSHHARPTCAGQEEGQPEPLPVSPQEGPYPRQMRRVLPLPRREHLLLLTPPHHTQLITTHSHPGRQCPRQHHPHFTDAETEAQSEEASFSSTPRESLVGPRGAHGAGGRQCAVETLRGPLAPSQTQRGHPLPAPTACLTPSAQPLGTVIPPSHPAGLVQS